MSETGVVTVFVSSTWIDLGPERRAIEFVLSKFDETKLVGMEHFGSRDEPTRDASLQEVDRSDLYVGILGPRYGSGITEAEYERARRKKLPCLFYVKTPSATAGTEGADPSRQQFLDRIESAHTVSRFSTPDELATQVAVDLHKWLSGRRLRAAAHAEEGDRELAAVASRVQQAWIKGVLERAVVGERRIQLGAAADAESLDALWARHVTAIEEGTPIERPSDDPIAKTFADASKALLILGEPGSGKTMTLLELTRDLLQYHDARLERAVPVVLSLASWRPAARGLLDWAIAELRSQYFVPTTLAERWLTQGRLHLMLDGLDEVPEIRRDGCVEAINAFLQDGKTAGVAVTCRSEQYQALNVRFTFYGAIRLLPLDDARIASYLAALGPTSAALRARVHGDADLLELARSPLMLSVMSAAMHGSSSEPLTTGAGPEALRVRLFALYVSRMFKSRRVQGAEEGRTIQSLAWLAREMHRNSWMVFSLDRLQPRLLMGLAATAAYALIASMLTVTIGFAGFGGANWPVWGFASCIVAIAAIDVLRLSWADRVLRDPSMVALARGLYLALYLFTPIAVGLATGTGADVGFFIVVLWVLAGWRLAWRGRDDDVRLMDQVGWRWSSAFRGAVLALVIVHVLSQLRCGRPPGSEWPTFFAALRDAFTEALTSPAAFMRAPGKFFGALLTQSRWIAALIMGGVMGGMQPRMSAGAARVDGRLRATLWRSLIGGVCLGAAVHGAFAKPEEMLQVDRAAGLLLAYFPLGFLWFGGLELIRHFSIRIVLAATRRFPFAAVRLLNEAVGLAFVRRAGSGYVFMHGMLLEHFAGLGSRSGPAIH